MIPIHLPPLRQRRDDIPLLLRHFCIKHGADKVTFDKQSLATLTGYGWPGNVRELENLVERLLIMRNGDTITSDDLPDKIRNGNSAAGTTVRFRLQSSTCRMKAILWSSWSGRSSYRLWNATGGTRPQRHDSCGSRDIR